MEPPFFGGGGSSGGGNNPREEALRWLTIAEKLLTARDLVGSKSFATRARDSDPNLIPAYQILAVVDTLIAAEKRINNQLDWYTILQLGPSHDSELIATQYRRLAILLNPQKNKLPFADQAFRLVVEAWSVLSNPSRKRAYDVQVSFHFYPQQPPVPPQQQPIPAVQSTTSHYLTRDKQPMFPSPPPPTAPAPAPPVQQAQSQYEQSQPRYSPPPPPPQPAPAPASVTTDAAAAAAASASAAANNVRNDNENDVDDENGEEIATFWTACPYCFHMYEYDKMYVECVLRCQKCRKAFHGAEVAAPPVVEGKEEYFCCWGYMPMGVSVKDLGKNGGGGGSSWTPFSPMFTCPQMPGASGNANNVWKSRGARKGMGSGPRIYIEDDDVFVEVSDPSEGESDDDWQKSEKMKKKKAKNVKAKTTPTSTPSKNVKKTPEKAKIPEVVSAENVPQGFVIQEGVGGMVNVVTVEPSKKGSASNTRRQPARVAKDFGKLDLNVEFSNEVEEPPPGMGHGHGAGGHQGHGAGQQGHGGGQRIEDNFEGTGFFEGLDEFLSSLPILNAVGDEKVKAA